MRYDNRIVVVTGASSGIGRAAAVEFARRGATLILVARGERGLRETAGLAENYGARPFIIPCDVSDKSQVSDARRIILERFDPPDILVNNAGILMLGTVSDVSIEDIELQMRTNYFGMVYCTKMLLPAMIERGSGHIVNVASLGASLAIPKLAPYCASKFAMLAFSEGLKYELEGTGVGMTVVSPITVRTPMTESLISTRFSLDVERVAKTIADAASSPKTEIIVPRLARLAVILRHVAPFVVKKGIKSAAKRL